MAGNRGPHAIVLRHLVRSDTAEEASTKFNSSQERFRTIRPLSKKNDIPFGVSDRYTQQHHLV